MRVADFEYALPEGSIAQEPAEPRDSSRLLDTRDMTDHRFRDLAQLLEPGDLVVVNETKVRYARVEGHRQGSGGRVELLFLERLPDGSWEALAKPARRLRPGAVIELAEGSAVIEDNLGEGLVRLHLDHADGEALLERIGSMPLPPYFTGHLADPDRYQTLFASTTGSAAAPTAGLHFTPAVVGSLTERGIGVAAVDLHVSLDTFRPMSVEQVQDHRMHSEWCSVPAETANAIRETRAQGSRVVAIGTTVVRTLESRASGDGLVRPGSGATDLFLTPGSDFRVVDMVVTNFHMPASTLIVLVAAFMGPEWRAAYETALERGYRFLSFGDAMLASRRVT